MLCNFYSENFEDIASLSFYEQNAEKDSQQDTTNCNKLTTDFGQFEWYSKAEPHLLVARIRCKMDKNTCLTGEVQGDGICLCFMFKGYSFYKFPNLKQQEIRGNKNNVFKIQDTTAVYDMFKNQECDCFEVFLPSKFVEKLMSYYPEEMDCLLKKIKKNNVSTLEEKHLNTTIQMEQVIRQIELASLMGNRSSMYIEAKVQELLSMQLYQCHMPLQASCENCIIRHKNKIEEARFLLERQYMNPPSIHDLARQVDTNDTTLKNGFKYFYDNTIYGYLFEYRMNIACQLLLDSNESIVDIADRAGYEHQSHFSTAFKRKFGVSPMEYRKRSF